MENELRNALLVTAAAYAEADGCAMSTVSRRVKNNASFFKGISNPKKSFTARTYDEVMGWFSKNWPGEKQKPLPLMTWIADAGVKAGASRRAIRP